FCCGFMSVYNTASVWMTFGSPFHILGAKNARNIHVFAIFIYVFGAMYRMVLILFEMNHRCEYFKILKFISSESNGELEERYFKKICLRMKLSGKYLPLYLKTIIIQLFILYITFAVILYFFDKQV